MFSRATPLGEQIRHQLEKVGGLPAAAHADTHRGFAGNRPDVEPPGGAGGQRRLLEVEQDGFECFDHWRNRKDPLPVMGQTGNESFRFQVPLSSTGLIALLPGHHQRGRLGAGACRRRG